MNQSSLIMLHVYVEYFIPINCVNHLEFMYCSKEVCVPCFSCVFEVALVEEVNCIILEAV